MPSLKDFQCLILFLVQPLFLVGLQEKPNDRKLSGALQFEGKPVDKHARGIAEEFNDRRGCRVAAEGVAVGPNEILEAGRNLG